MAKRRVTQQATLDFSFFDALHQFYRDNRGRVRSSYRDLSKRFLDHNDPAKNPAAYLRTPQFEALEIYVFLKEFLANQPVHALFADWLHYQGKFQGRTTFAPAIQLGLFNMATEDQFGHAFTLLTAQLAANQRAYANYIFALTMGTGKTILMATCIFYEFILANKFPKDPKYCHNAIVFAPDTTVLEALREIMTFDLTKVVPPEYVNWLTAHIQYHFLDEAGMTLATLDKSMFNVIISNTQKIILKRQHKAKTAAAQLFNNTPSYTPGSVYDQNSDLYEFDQPEDEAELTTNQRFEKLRRLTQLGIYVDEAHHAFGKNLARDVGAIADNRATSLRLTIDELARSLERSGTHVVACYNYTGTPYAEEQILPEVVYSYGLKAAIGNGYLKNVEINGYANVRNDNFVDRAIDDFLQKVGTTRHEGLLPKMAFFASEIDELQNELRPAVESALARHGIPADRILVNVGDEKLTKADDIREFNQLDRPKSEKQFILLVGKGREGWNCRSLFAVALYRKPKSTIFVLQATMRCLRAIGQGQQTGHVYLSDQNIEILKNELQQNFRVTVDEISVAGSGSSQVYVHVEPPPVKLTLKRVRHLYTLRDKQLKPGASLELDQAPTDRYIALHTTYDGLPETDARPTAVEDISYLHQQRNFSRLTLVSEISRYLNRSPIEVQSILDQTAEGTDRILQSINQHNELLYDWIIPRLFGHLSEIKEYKHEEEQEIELVKQPELGYYTVTAKPDKTVYKTDSAANQSAKSFHLDVYCFDSNPEQDLFWRLLRDERIKKVYFTGMLTHGQSDFYIQYIDPETHALRSYYPDFVIQKADDSWAIIEVKADNQIDDPIVQAKATFAQQLAVTNGMKYKLMPSTQARTGNYDYFFNGKTYEQEKLST